jgi:hypothetical protein
MTLTGALAQRRAGGSLETPPLRILLALVVSLLLARDASADWMFTPFVGTSFGTETSFVVLEIDRANSTQPSSAPTRKLIFGGSAAFLSRGVFGAEADFAYAPRFFERDNRAGDITGSNLSTLSGSVILAAPLAVTRESLRPYVVGGFGLIHAEVSDTINLLPIRDNIAAYNIGGGAIGLISPRAGLRFEIRHFRSVENSSNELTAESSARLSFWRATVGVVIRVAN